MSDEKILNSLGESVPCLYFHRPGPKNTGQTLKCVARRADELDEIIAYTLRLFGEGTKVAVEIALMASDAGLIPAGEDCISVGGTGRGADTAVLLRADNAQSFFDLKIMEILAKPRL